MYAKQLNLNGPTLFASYSANLHHCVLAILSFVVFNSK
jgi:hypothetical protein